MRGVLLALAVLALHGRAGADELERRYGVGRPLSVQERHALELFDLNLRRLAGVRESALRASRRDRKDDPFPRLEGYLQQDVCRLRDCARQRLLAGAALACAYGGPGDSNVAAGDGSIAWNGVGDPKAEARAGALSLGGFALGPRALAAGDDAWAIGADARALRGGRACGRGALAIGRGSAALGADAVACAGVPERRAEGEAAAKLAQACVGRLPRWIPAGASGESTPDGLARMLTSAAPTGSPAAPGQPPCEKSPEATSPESADAFVTRTLAVFCPLPAAEADGAIAAARIPPRALRSQAAPAAPIIPPGGKPPPEPPPVFAPALSPHPNGKLPTPPTEQVREAPPATPGPSVTFVAPPAPRTSPADAVIEPHERAAARASPRSRPRKRPLPRGEVSAPAPGHAESLVPGEAPAAAEHRVSAPAVEQDDAGVGKERRDPIPDLIRQLSAADVRARARAADELGSRGKDAADAVPALEKSLSDKSAKVRASAALALGKIRLPSRRTLERLAEAARDDNEDVRDSAKLALERLRAQP